MCLCVQHVFLSCPAISFQATASLAMNLSRLVFEDDDGAAGIAEDAWLQRATSMQNLEALLKKGLEHSEVLYGSISVCMSAYVWTDAWMHGWVALG